MEVDRVMPLNEEQLETLPRRLNKKRRPVRFLVDGCAVNICTGILEKKGSNIINHPVYWDRPFAFVAQVVNYLSGNNPGKKITITYH